MKTYLSKTKIIALALVTFFTTSITAPAIANDGDKDVEIAYIGNMNELPVYRLSLKNKTSEIYFVSITDRDGNLIYKEKVSGANIVRNYQFDEEIYADYDLTFTISTPKGKTVSEYNVSRSKKTINEVAVSKIK